MLKNYLTTALRVLKRNRVFTFINISGLGLGMACCLLIYIFVSHELSYDQFHEHKDRIYRVTYHPPNIEDLARVPPPLAPNMKEYFPEIASAARAFPRNVSVRVSKDADIRNFEETDVLFVDSTFHKILTLHPISGSLGRSLSDPSSVVLTDETAEKYFGTTDVLNREVVLEGKYPFKVGAVVKNFPDHSHLHFNALLNYESMYDLEGKAGEKVKQNFSMNFVASHSYTYVLLAEGASPDAINNQFEAFVKERVHPKLQIGQSFSLFPVPDIHVYSNMALEPEPGVGINYMYLFAGIAMLTLLIACFNFVNLSTAQSVKRAKEVGMRKVMGAGKKDLFAQFLGESVCISGFALLAALVFVVAGLPYLNELTGKSLSEKDLLTPEILVGLPAILVVTGLLGGVYPAVYISRIRLLTSVKGNTGLRGNKGLNLRKVLVTFQFALSVLLITGALIIAFQLNFIRNQPMGFQTEEMMTVPVYSQNMNSSFSGMDENMHQRLRMFEATILRNSRVKAATLSGSLPGLGVVNRQVNYEGMNPDERLFVPVLSVDYDFLPTYDLQIIAGRDFNRQAGTDHKSSFIINETAVTAFNFGSQQEALGKVINVEGKEGTVIGIVKDFHFEPLRTPVAALIMDVGISQLNTFSFRVNTSELSETIAYVEKQWKEHFPEKAFEYSFIQENLESMYQGERKLGKIIRIFAVLAIIVSCLGSYGLILFSARQREKEIGIRKVLGAPFIRLIMLLFREFTLLYLIGFVLAVPFIIYLGSKWLENFSYAIDIDPYIFLISGILTLVLVWGTISIQSVRAVLVNPVESLRNE